LSQSRGNVSSSVMVLAVCGLAIVKHIVQLHHGALRIESRLREGTTVTVWLPVNQPNAN
jgi:light-regulated signal transduction histidine kinase (bacteriophytochrome)